MAGYSLRKNVAGDAGGDEINCFEYGSSFALNGCAVLGCMRLAGQVAAFVGASRARCTGMLQETHRMHATGAK